MSYFIVGVLVPGYEDYDQYGCKGNAFVGFPSMWPEERYAEAALWREHKDMLDQAKMRRRLSDYDTLAPKRSREDNVPCIVRALVSIARENHWEVKNAQAVETAHVTPIFTIPPDITEKDERPQKWEDIVRWMDRQKTKEENEAAKMEDQKAEERERMKRANSFHIDGEALINLMGDMMPYQPTMKVKPTFNSRQELVAYCIASIAEENKWEMTDPDGSFWWAVRPVYRIA